jgi:hypothetical protein
MTRLVALTIRYGDHMRAAYISDNYPEKPLALNPVVPTSSDGALYPSALLGHV